MKKKLFFVLPFFISLFCFSLSSCNNNELDNVQEEKNESESTQIAERNSDDDKIHQIYLQALDSGYEGTYEEWLASIKGKDGHTPIITIGENGNWYVDNVDTNVKARGIDGSDAVSIKSIEKESSSDNVDTYKITYSDNTYSYFTINNGINGKTAYQIYIENNPNYCGDEKQWIDDLVNGKLISSSVVYSNSLNIIMTFYEGEEIVLPEDACVYSITEDRWMYANINWNMLDKDYKCGTYEIYGTVEGLKKEVVCKLNIKNYSSKLKTVDGFVNGLADGSEANVILYNQDTYFTTTTNNGFYKFENIENGDYLIRAEAINYYSSDNVEVHISDIDITNKSIFDNVAHVSFDLNYIYDYSYYYCWNSNQYYFGDEMSSAINVPNIVEINGYKNVISDNSASLNLISDYNVYLSNDGDQTWNSQYANSFLNSLNRLGVNLTKKSVWTITNDYLENDIVINSGEEFDSIIISKYALVYCSPLSGKLNGVNGTFFSKRLYTAITRYVTKNGTDTELVDNILKNNFSLSIFVPDYNELTNGTTNEGPEMFQQFSPEELLDILAMYEEMPEGYHKINGFNYIIRRKTGLPHPIYFEAAAVTWPTNGYIEFMSSAFTTVSSFHTYRLLIHESTHMLWAHVFNEELKKSWAEIGGWYQDDPSSDNWYTTKTTEFVTSYAHDFNPDEDMAESAAYYILDPEALKSRAPKKYEFLEQYVFHGSKYISKIRDDLTFEVLNLMPDYDYPGRIIKIEIMSNSSIYEDKEFKIRLTLKEQEGYNDSASGAGCRIGNINNPSKYVDVGFSVVDGKGYVLEGLFKVTKTTESGYYMPGSIVVSDIHGNQRMEGVKNFGFKLYVDNPLEDLIAPTLEEDSIEISVTEIPQEDITDFSDYKVDIKLKVIEENLKADNAVFARIYPVVHNPDYNCIDGWGSLEKDGFYHIYYMLTDYYPTGDYYIEFLSLNDNSKNITNYDRYSTFLRDEKIKFNVPTRYPDYEAPELDLNRISITAIPTNPDAPNGETEVIIKVWIKDDASGYTLGYYGLVDPQGLQHFSHVYPESYGKVHFVGDPTVWKEYTIVTILPPGSAPGIWGLYEFTLIDIAKNQRKYSFVEIVHFVID